MGVIDLSGMIDRMGAIEKEALAGLTPSVTADAVDYFFHNQERFPFFTHRVGPATIDADSQQLDIYTVTVVARLVIGHITEGAVKGQAEGKLQTYIPQVANTFNRREGLQSATYPDRMPRLRYARCTGVSGFGVFQNAGTIGQQVGTEFTVEAVFVNAIEQDYL